MEIWKDILGYERLYQVSSKGRIKSLSRKIDNGLRQFISKETILKPGIAQHGYLQVDLYRNGIGTTKLVHRLILESFIDKSKLNCNHVNGVKNDNRLENLEWATQSENIKHSYKIGLRKPTKGQDHYKSKLTNKDIILIRKIGSRCSQRAVATLFDVSHSTIGYILNNKTWNHVSC